jgi:dTDP-glucose 4,6-dehydratase
VRADICDRLAIESLFQEYAPDAVIYLPAESHVDRSVAGPEAFVRTNVLGTHTLLDVARCFWDGQQGCLFHHVSTDEVYGSLGSEGSFTEQTCYNPSSPYSASKAGSDHLVMSYHHTYELPVTMSNCSNNYGPYQFPEKLVPLMILNMLESKPLPVYGDGRNVRDWLYVEDHCAAIWKIVTEGRVGARYNVGGRSERENNRLVKELCSIVADAAGGSAAELERLVTHVKDRPGHDLRYSIDCSRIEEELGWHPSVSLEQGLRLTVRWYRENMRWVDHVRSCSYRDWIAVNYGNR